MPDISVLMSTVTVDEWLADAVESVLDQRDVSSEVIVVLDGAAVDDRPTWMRDPRVRTIALPKRSGLSNALCVAAGEAEGEFLARMDADDISLPGRLARTQHYLEADSDVCVVGTAADLIDRTGRIVGEMRPRSGDDVRRALVARNQLMHPSVTMRRSVYVAVGGYDPTLRQMEDYDLWLRMALVGRVAVLPDKLLQYRVHATQMSRSAAPYGSHVRSVSRGQYRLGRALGMSVPAVASSVLLWRAAQFARHTGLRRAGYDKAAVRSDEE